MPVLLHLLPSRNYPLISPPFPVKGLTFLMHPLLFHLFFHHFFERVDAIARNTANLDIGLRFLMVLRADGRR